MALIIRNLRLAPEENEALLFSKAAAALGVHGDNVKNLRIVRRSLDARKKSDVHFLYSVRVETDGEETLLKRCGSDVEREEKQERTPIRHGDKKLCGRPVVVGSGPCGMFAALTLAREGYRPVVLERGAPVEQRSGEVERFFSTGELNEDSNVLFGEGGAGTFSDGKLTTRIKDPKCKDVLCDLARFGAEESAIYDAKPHIGTDVLRKVVAGIRREILSLGGEYRFLTKVTGLTVEQGELSAIAAEGGMIRTSACILACGHSARDVYAFLNGEGVELAGKPFAAGVRIEHPREMIDAAQLGGFAGNPRIGAAEYHLTDKQGDRGVYTFCMCPGGYVVASASEKGGVVTNGMSYSDRGGKNSNSAIVVSVSPEDFGYGAMNGIAFQRELEKAAYQLGGGGYLAPAQRAADFLSKRPSKGFGGIEPTYRPGTTPCDLSRCLPDFIADGIRKALPVFGRMLKGFDIGDAVLTAVESRTSSCVRIARNADYQSPSARGLFPAGEGAGYAGGIVSAAVDGVRAAEALIGIFASGGHDD